MCEETDSGLNVAGLTHDLHIYIRILLLGDVASIKKKFYLYYVYKEEQFSTKKRMKNRNPWIFHFLSSCPGCLVS